MTDLSEILTRAAQGKFPQPDWSVDLAPAPVNAVAALLSFTGHTVVATAVPAEEMRQHLSNAELGGTGHPAFLTWLGERTASEPEPTDLVLVSTYRGEPAAAIPDLEARSDLAHHPRVARALVHRKEVAIYSDKLRRGVLTIGRGLAWRWEVSIEVQPEHRGSGIGRMLAAAAPTLVDGAIFAQVNPGNAASVRAFLAAGYRPIGSEILFQTPTDATREQ